MATGINFVMTPNPGPSTPRGLNFVGQTRGPQPALQDHGSTADAGGSRWPFDGMVKGIAGSNGGAGSVGNGYKPFGSLR